MNGKILIVEDNQMLSTIYCQLLQSAGYLVETAYSGQQALSLLAKEVPDLILLDLHLPELSGDHLISFIKNETRFVDTKIILHSADNRLATQFLNQADSYVSKPSSTKDLLSSVQQLLGSVDI